MRTFTRAHGTSWGATIKPVAAPGVAWNCGGNQFSAGASQPMAYKPFDADALIDASAPMLQLRIEPEYRAAIKANLKTASKMAALVEQITLTDEAEPAPVFKA